MPTSDPSVVELAKLWSTAAAAIGVAVFGFATNLIITLMRTGKRELEMRRLETELRVKAELRLKLFALQAESVRDLTTSVIQVVDAMDDWSHVLVTAHQRSIPEFNQHYSEKQDEALAAKRRFTSAGLFMPPELHKAYEVLSDTVLPRFVEIAKAADARDVAAMRDHLPTLYSAVRTWSRAVMDWKVHAWADVDLGSSERSNESA